MAVWIKQGDAYKVPVKVQLNGAPLNVQEVEAAEFRIGDVRRMYPEEAEYDHAEGAFMVPVTQEETLEFPPNDAVAADVRIRFRGGDVIGAKKMVYVTVFDAVSEEVL